MSGIESDTGAATFSTGAVRALDVGAEVAAEVRGRAPTEAAVDGAGGPVSVAETARSPIPTTPSTAADSAGVGRRFRLLDRPWREPVP